MRHRAYKDFSGGLNTTDNPFSLLPNELQQLDNFNVDRRGKIMVRRGYVTINTVALTGTEVIGLHRFYRNTGPPILFALTPSRLLTFNDTRGYVETTDAPKITKKRGFFTNFRDRVYYTAGGSVRWNNGASDGDPLVSPPSSPAFRVHIEESPAAPSSGTNQVTGQHVWTMTCYDNYGESVFGPKVWTTYEATEFFHAHLQGINSTTLYNLRLWRAQVAGGATGEYKLLTTLPLNTQPAYEDNTGSTFLGGSWDSLIKLDTPTLFEARVLVKFSERLFVVDEGDPTMLRWTREYEPSSWPAANYMHIGRQDGEDIEALVPLADRLLVFKTTKMYAVFGDFDEANPNYSISLISDRVGTRHPFSAVADGNVVYFLAEDGVWRYDGRLVYVSNKIKKTLQDLALDTNKEYAAAVIHNRQYWLSVSEGGQQNDATYVLDLNFLDQGSEVWTRYDYGMQAFAACVNDTSHDGVVGVLMGGDYSGYVHRLDYTQNDSYSPITAVAKTAPWDCDLPNDRKRFRAVWPWVEATQGDLEVTVDADYGIQSQTHTHSLAGSPGRPTAHKLVSEVNILGNVAEFKLTHSTPSYGMSIVAVELAYDERPHR